MAVPGQLQGKISRTCDSSILTAPPRSHSRIPCLHANSKPQAFTSPAVDLSCSALPVTSGIFASSPAGVKVCLWLAQPEPRRNSFACSVTRPRKSASAKSTAAPAKAKLTLGFVKTGCIIARLAARPATTEPPTKIRSRPSRDTRRTRSASRLKSRPQSRRIQPPPVSLA